MRAKLISTVCVLMVVVGVPAANAATYVIDQNHPKTADTNAGTPEAPWKTIGKAAATARAGDRVCVMEGSYDEKVVLPATAAGQPDRKTVFISCPEQAVTMKGFDLNGAGYVRIEGFRITDGRVENLGDGAEVVGNYFQDATSAYGSVGLGAGESQPKGVYVGYNQMYHVQKGIWIYGSDWIVESNEVERLKNWGTGDADYGRFFGEGHIIRYNYFHGSRLEDTGTAHVDAFQTFQSAGRADEFARRIRFENNVFMNFGQAIIAQAEDGTSFLSDIVVRGNILAYGYVGTGGAAWGLCLANVGNITVENNLIAGIKYHGLGLRSAGSAVVRNNIFHNTTYWAEGAATMQAARNIVFEPDVAPPSASDINKDPMFVNFEARNFRLRPGSPAIDAGEGKSDIGPLAYPNVYYVDGRHPAANNDGYGYPAIPFKTISKAVSVAEPGETIVVRGGVYRELVKPEKPGVTIRAMEGEKVVVSGADEVAGWGRDGDKWSARLAAKPVKLLRDGQVFADFTYDEAAKRITVSGMDPRMHLLETVVRDAGIDTKGVDVKIEGIETANILGNGK
jgi:hypothetical protein